MDTMDTREIEKFMRRALELASRGRGRTSPNPMVGAVIVRSGEIVAEGWHHAAGRPHAEIEALEAAGVDVTGATMFVNLEPCSHQGRTPPCAPAVAASGISRVVIGMKDPNPLVSGRGIGVLEAAGVEVVSGILEKECAKLNEAFIKHITTGLPFVILKTAMTLDGKTASRTGDSKWISSDASREMVHRLRGEADAVMVGSGTMLHDDASLTSRIPQKIKDPLRVVLDSRLRVTAESSFCRLAGDGNSVIITTDGAPSDREKKLAGCGCRIIRVDQDAKGRPDPAGAMRELGKMGVTSVMVEGGGELNFSLLEAGLVDKVLVFIAPALLGGRDAKTFMDGEGFEEISGAIPLKEVSVSMIDRDILVEAYIDRAPSPPAKEEDSD